MPISPEDFDKPGFEIKPDSGHINEKGEFVRGKHVQTETDETKKAQKKPEMPDHLL